VTGRNLRWQTGTVVLLACLAVGVARADSRAEAKRHFKAGMALIDDGQDQAGMEELERAYALSPHPAVLFNIARAAEHAHDPPRAISAYQRYLESAPADAADVEARLAVLLSQQRTVVVTPPPQVLPPPAVEPLAPGESLPIPLPTEEDPRALRAAAALARALAAAMAGDAGVPHPPPASDAGTVSVEDSGPPPPTPVDAGSPPVPPPPVAVKPNADTIFAEQSVTASRTQSDVLDAPAFVTVITREEIDQSGARTVPDLLRQIPGVTVVQMTQSDFNVAIRGLNRRLSNKVLVLVDGRSVYQDFLGGTAWEALPVNLEDIERIEVVRGPGAVLYGASAFGGVVNLITRQPDAFGVEAAGDLGLPRQGRLTARTQGTLKLRNVAAPLAQACKPAWTCALLKRALHNPRVVGVASGGLRDVDREELVRPRADLVRIIPDPSTSGRSGRGFAMVEVQASPEHTLRLEGGAVRFRQDLNALGSLRNYMLDGSLAWAQARYTAGPLSARAFYTGFYLDAQPELTPRNPDPLKTHVTTHLLDVEPLLSLPFRLLGEHRLVAGAAWRFKSVAWSYLDASHVQNLLSAFLQETWHPVPALTGMVSYRVDRHPLAPVQQWDVPGVGRLGVPPLPGLSHSARAAVMARVFNTTLRLGAGTAFRDPTFMESYVDFDLPLPVDGAVLRFQGTPHLFPERIASLEAGLSTRASDRFALDAQVYVMAVDRLIELKTPEVNSSAGLDPSGHYVVGRGGFGNSGQVLLGGGSELLVRFFPLDGVDVDVGVAQHRLFATASRDPVSFLTGSSSVPGTRDFAARQEDPPYRATTALRVRLPLGLEGGAAASLTGPTVWHEETVDPQSPTGVRITETALDPYLNTQVRLGWRLMSGAVVVSAVGQNLLAPSHREHPLGDRLGPRGMVTVAVRP
jgi:iron complex outermembrane receptor protein